MSNDHYMPLRTKRSMMTSPMETFSALLALCAGNSPGPVNSPHKGQWREALMFSLICARINDWVNNREAGDLRRHRGHYDVNVMIAKQTGACVTCMCRKSYVLPTNLAQPLYKLRLNYYIGIATLEELSSSPLGQNYRHFPEDIFRCVFVNEKVGILIKSSLKFVPPGSINNIPALV